MTKLTKQGVRDLNDIPSKPRGRRLPMPPRPICSHAHTITRTIGDVLYETCLTCNKSWAPYEDC